MPKGVKKNPKPTTQRIYTTGKLRRLSEPFPNPTPAGASLLPGIRPGKERAGEGPARHSKTGVKGCQAAPTPPVSADNGRGAGRGEKPLRAPAEESPRPPSRPADPDSPQAGGRGGSPASGAAPAAGESHLSCHAGSPLLEALSHRGQEAKASNSAEERRRPPAAHGAEASAAAPAPAAGRLLPRHVAGGTGGRRR